MNKEHLDNNPTRNTISHNELVDAVTEEVFKLYRKKGDGITPPHVVMRLIAFTVSPEYAAELIEEAKLQTTDTS